MVVIASEKGVSGAYQYHLADRSGMLELFPQLSDCLCQPLGGWEMYVNLSASC